MTLYYLQQRKPPVIPVLQELYPDGETKPEVIIEGWNVWFFEDIDHRQGVWSEFGQNSESVGELWLDMLWFYTKDFTIKKYVVCIHITKAFIKGRSLFGTPIDKLPATYYTQMDYFFDSRQLTDGWRSNHRGCHRCGKADHRFTEATASRHHRTNVIQTINSDVTAVHLACPATTPTTDLLSRRRSPEIGNSAKMLTPGQQQTSAGPKNCQVDEEGGGDVPWGDVRALVDRQPFTLQRLDTPPFHQERRRTNPTGVPLGPRSIDIYKDQREAYRPPKVMLETLKQPHILPLQKKSTRLPRAEFYCHLCHRHLGDVAYAEKHIQPDVHLIKKAASDLRMDVKNLPYPVDIQCGAISNFVKEDIELRRRIAEELEALIKATLPDVRLTLHGSSVNGFGLKTSKVDMDLPPVGKAGAVKLFIETGYLLLQCPKYSNVQKDFSFKVPRMRFRDVGSNIFCEISLNNCNSLKTSRLLDYYVSLAPRVQTRGVAFWFRAKICGLDQQEQGTLPAHSFAVMTVFFLQQCKPVVLPVLHELEVCDEFESYVKPKEQERRLGGEKYRSVGQLWVELLRLYAVEFKLNKHVVCIRKSQPIVIAEKNWNKRYIAVEDPYSSKWNLARSIPSCLRSSAVYFLLPQLRSGPMFTMLPGPPHYKDDLEFESESNQEEDKLKGKKERQNEPVMIEGWNAWFFEEIDRRQGVWSEFGQCSESVGKLWLGMLWFYTEDFNFKKHVVRTPPKDSRCIAIDDPFDLHHNLGIGVSQKMYIYILKAFIKGRSSFGAPIDKPPATYSTQVDYSATERRTAAQRPRVSPVRQDWSPHQGVPATAGSGH
ncbi:hypothetical protein HPB48_010729 [Haemaphysalis longicornis]|uniref:C2H2-type domain-containing protein n=1 Tax=Haemaphysalis longicornis TaxID=44386 RepID=A0A9J6G7V1_HAELO|nr:hypothetical protein HPB48_010729 [Haemaphysalis longicornis]